MDGRGRRKAVLAALLAGAAALWPGTGMVRAQSGEAVFVESDLPAFVLGADDAPAGTQYYDSEFLDLQGSLPQRYDALIEAGVQAVYRSTFDIGDDASGYIFSHAMLFPDGASASRALPLLCSGCTGPVLELGEEGFIWGDDQVHQLAWRRSNVLLEVMVAPTGDEPAPGLAESRALAEEMDARALARMPAPEEDAGGQASATESEDALPQVALIAAALLTLVAVLGAVALRMRTRAAGTAPEPAPGAPGPRASSGGKTKFCRECGAPHPAEARFCGSCGHPFR